jgi:hypothetical protein
MIQPQAGAAVHGGCARLLAARAWETLPGGALGLAAAKLILPLRS